MKRLLQVLLTSLFALSAVPVFAADIPVRMPVKSPVYVPAFSWTGFYVGGNVGWGWADGSGTITVAGLGTGPTSGSGDGILGGVQLGYNWQFGSIVFGLEADIQASGGKGNATATPGGTLITATTKNPWFSTFRGRIGYAVDRWMFYVTGGGAYGEAEAAFSGGFGTQSVTGWAYVVGGGIEWALWERWSAKLEYLYSGTPEKVPLPAGAFNATGDINSNILRVGLNYRF